MGLGDQETLVRRWQRKLHWLAVDTKGKLYCKLCPATQRKDGLDHHYGHLKQHTRTYAHRVAAAQDPHMAAVMNWERGPSLDQFRKVWDHICAGHPPWQGVEGVGSRTKVTDIRRCIAEALRARDRKFIQDLRPPCSICLLRDESAHRLLLTFNAVNSDLEMRTGLLGWIHCSIGDAVTKTNETEAAMKAFCTPPHGELDVNLYEKLRHSVEFMATDAASSELLSVKMMQRGTNLDGVNPVTPKLRSHTRDKAHSTKRILCRPFDADEFWKSIINRFIMAKGTLVSIINYSEDFLTYFKSRCKAHGMQPMPLGLAKHRFSCIRKVLTLLCTHFMPLMDTAVYMRGSREASSRPAALAPEFLEETDETRIQIGMMADAADQVMHLLRFVDQNHPDLSLVSNEVGQFRKQVQDLAANHSQAIRCNRS